MSVSYAMVDNLLFTIMAVLPLYIVVIAGYFFKRRSSFDESFITFSNDIVFNIAFPSVIFIKIATADISSIFSVGEIIASVGAYVVVIFIASAAAPFFYSNRRDQGAFIQGSFKGNIAILGLGLAFTLYGDRGIAHAAVIMVFLVPFANIMAVLILTAYSDEGDSLPVKQLVFKVISNPVILAVLLGLPFSLIPMKVPAVAETTVNYFARLMLPLALFTMGTGLEIEEIKKGMVPAAAASFLKIIVMPAAALVFCLVFHVEKEGMGIIISITGVPSGISSYILATAFNSNHELASHILIISTFAALGTLSLGLAILMNFGMI